VVLEELGRAAAPVPFLTSAVIATTVLVDCAAEDSLDALASGTRTAALVVPLSQQLDADLPAAAVDPDGRVTATITSVAGALEADNLLVAIKTSEGLAVYAIDSTEATLTPVVSLDMSRQLADVTFDGAAGRLVTADGANAVRRGLLAGTALLASEQLGIAQWCLATTVTYLKDRRQFGQTLGGFQALKHRLALLHARVESAGAAARYAAATLATRDRDAEIAAAVAQSYCSDVAVLAAEEAIQLLGGIGMTWEHPCHLYLKRAKADHIALGTPGSHNTRLGRLVDLS